MVKQRLQYVILGSIGLIAVVVAIIILGFRERPRSREKVITAAVIRVISDGVSEFCRQYGHWPKGSNAEIARLLQGENVSSQNPDGKVFVHEMVKKLKNPADEIVDGWGTPLALFTDDSDRFVVHSFGRNRKNDGGKEDDILFRVEKP